MNLLRARQLGHTAVSGSDIVKLVWLVCCNFHNALAATKHEEMSCVDNPLIFIQTNGFNFLYIFMALQMEGFCFWVFLSFLFEELEEFSKKEALVRRNQM